MFTTKYTTVIRDIPKFRSYKICHMQVHNISKTYQQDIEIDNIEPVARDILTTNHIAIHIANIPFTFAKNVILYIDKTYLANITKGKHGNIYLDTELCASPMSTLVVILDLAIRLQAKPLRDWLVLLGSNT